MDVFLSLKWVLSEFALQNLIHICISEWFLIVKKNCVKNQLSTQHDYLFKKI